jgi:hypothetical protein
MRNDGQIRVDSFSLFLAQLNGHLLLILVVVVGCHVALSNEKR